MRLSTLLVSATLLSMPVSVVAAPIPALFVFGDSLADTGNLSALFGGALPGAPYAPGVASNGPLAVQTLAASLGLPLLPAAIGGTNFAVIGAATGPVAFPTPGDPGNTADNLAEAIGLPLAVPTGILNAQVPTFLATVAPVLPPTTIADALFFIWGGPNDIAINFARGLGADPNVPAEAAARIGLSIDLLYGAGARHFFVPNMPDLGLTPGASNPALATAASLLFNQALANELAARSLTLPGLHLTTFDTFSFFQSVVANPGLAGFSNVTDPCYVGPLLGTGPPVSLCADDDAYLFWDGSHPTTQAHALLGQQFAAALDDQAVPEPATLLLTLAGVAGIVARRRRAAH